MIKGEPNVRNAIFSRLVGGHFQPIFKKRSLLRRQAAVSIFKISLLAGCNEKDFEGGHDHGALDVKELGQIEHRLMTAATEEWLDPSAQPTVGDVLASETFSSDQRAMEEV